MNAIEKATVAAITVFSLCICGCSDGRDVLEVYSWSDYFEPSLIERFERENGCRVSMTSFDSNEAMYAKLKAGGCGYDVMVPSSYMIPMMAREGIISEIDTNLLPNVMRNFDRSFDAQVSDGSFRWSVPYACSYTGLMYSGEITVTVS